MYLVHSASCKVFNVQQNHVNDSWQRDSGTWHNTSVWDCHGIVIPQIVTRIIPSLPFLLFVYTLLQLILQYHVMYSSWPSNTANCTVTTSHLTSTAASIIFLRKHNLVTIATLQITLYIHLFDCFFWILLVLTRFTLQ